MYVYYRLHCIIRICPNRCLCYFDLQSLRNAFQRLCEYNYELLSGYHWHPKRNTFLAIRVSSATIVNACKSSTWEISCSYSLPILSTKALALVISKQCIANLSLRTMNGRNNLTPSKPLVLGRRYHTSKLILYRLTMALLSSISH
jgi:hypothetical protein